MAGLNFVLVHDDFMIIIVLAFIIWNIRHFSCRAGVISLRAAHRQTSGFPESSLSLLLYYLVGATDLDRTSVRRLFSQAVNDVSQLTFHPFFMAPAASL
jgi:hypothetical protein